MFFLIYYILFSHTHLLLLQIYSNAINKWCWLLLALWGLLIICQLLVDGCRLSAVGCRVSVVSCRCRSLLLRADCRVLAVGMLVADCRLLLSFIVVEIWLSYVGCRMTVADCQLLLSFIDFSCCMSCVHCRVSDDDCRCHLSIKILIVDAQLCWWGICKLYKLIFKVTPYRFLTKYLCIYFFLNPISISLGHNCPCPV